MSQFSVWKTLFCMHESFHNEYKIDETTGSQVFKLIYFSRLQCTPRSERNAIQIDVENKKVKLIVSRDTCINENTQKMNLRKYISSYMFS
jgi:hypothetical protein